MNRMTMLRFRRARGGRGRPLRTAALLPLLALGLMMLLVPPQPLEADTQRSREFLSDALDRLERGEHSAALIQLRNALQEDPGNLDARLLLGRLYLLRGDLAAAETELRRVYDAQPGDEVELLLGQALLGLGRAEQALAVVGREAADPEFAEGKALLRAGALLNLGRLNEAGDELAPVLRASPLSPGANLLAARLSLAKGDLAAARDSVQRAIEVDPNSPSAWALKANIAVIEGNYDEALAAADEVERLRPGDRTARLMRAEILAHRGEAEEAERILGGLLEQAPDDPAANFLLATLQASRGAFADADANLRRIAEATRTWPPAILLHGLVKLSREQYAQAESLLSRYVAAVPDNRSVRRLLADLQLRTDKPHAAVDTLAPVAGPGSQDVSSLRLQSSAQIRAGELRGAAATLRRLAEVGQGREAQQAQTMLSLLQGEAGGGGAPSEAARRRMLLVFDYLRSGEGEAALAEVTALAEEYPDSPEVLNLLGAVRLGRGEDAEAREAFERALAIDPAFASAADNLDRLDVRAGRLDELERRLRERIAAGLNPEGSAVRLAGVLARLERGEEALALLREQAEAQPRSVPIRVALATLARTLGDDDTARRAADELMAIGDPAALEAAGWIHLAAGALDEAAEAFTRLSQARSGEPAPLLALARSQYLQGRADEARRTLEALRQAHPDHPVANESLVDLELEAGRVDDALAFADRLEDVDPEQAARLRAKVLLHADRGEEAAAALAEAFAAAPSSTLARDLFLVRREAGKGEEALAGLRDWLTAHPDDAAALELLGQAYIERGEYAAAVTPLERAIQLQPNDPDALNNLSWLLSELGRPGALALARRAHQIAPNAPEISDTLGWILVQEGELEEGLALLREADESLGDDNPAVRYHLAYALNQAGEPERAREILEQLLSRPEPFPEVERARLLLDSLDRS